MALHQNISWPTSDKDVKTEAYRLFGIFLQNQINDPSVGFGAPTGEQGKGGQRLFYTHTTRREYPFRVTGLINIDEITGKWQAGPGGGQVGNTHTGSGGDAMQKDSSYVLIHGGYINCQTVKIGGTDLNRNPRKEYIPSELFKNNYPIGVALYCGAMKSDLLAEKYDPKFSVKFHSISNISSLGKLSRSYRNLFDLKWLWNGTRARGNGSLRNGGATFKEGNSWSGSPPAPEGDTCGRILLCIITPPPFPMFVPVVTRNLSHGIYMTEWGTHKHVFF